MITVKVFLAFLVVTLLNASEAIKLLQTLHQEFLDPAQPIFLLSGYSLDLSM